LLELAVVMAILALTLTFVLPSLGDMVATHRVRAARDALRGALQRAHFEALRHKVRVVVCKSASGLSCAAQDEWHQGWIIFHDRNNTGQLDAGESVLYQEPALPAVVRINSVGSGGGKINYVSFVMHGGSRGVSSPPSDLGGALQMGHFDVCAVGLTPISGSQIVLRQTGHTRLETSKPQQCSGL
jgi:type IV fimbrial biogenesis protein FimT